MTNLSLTVNGRAVEAAIEARTNLADFVREKLDLTGTHTGCEHGVCGACTMIVDGMPVRSCITFAVACGRASITTIEGLDEDEIAAELRTAFSREHALQCGYCTPGMLVSARDLVLRLPDADEEQIRIGMSGNLCRCTGYVGIVRAVRAVIASRRERGIAPVPGAGREQLGPAGAGHKSGASVSDRKSKRAKASVTPAKIEIPDFAPTVVFEQRFDVAHAPDRVFDFFGDVAAVASCLPGAVLNEDATPEHVNGAFRVKIGPITASFNGSARIERDIESRSGRIVGVGADQRSRSSTQGEIRYRVVSLDDAAKTRVELTIGYSLKGMLAQVGRPGLVRDLASRLISEFAGNVNRHLAGAPAAADPRMASSLNAFSLILGLVSSQAKRLLRRLTGGD
ncbi:xanthine dehydrogenase family Fe-S subunit [Bradyrhizobium sp. BR 1432]|uniref:xanthine dehydrogenase family Fe-S subunit n=1 Tax=Bradyrhizobium sp. BR 1432 TaxID=3447966 RepID=UPI003EE659B7